MDTGTVLLLRVSDEYYSLSDTTVREVARWRKPTPVPGAPPVLPGVINQRGVVVPVVSLHALLDFPPVQPDRATRYVIAQHDEIDLALLVDAVIDLIELAPASLEPTPAALDPQRARLLRAVARHTDQLVGLLDLGAVINAVRTGA